MSRLDEIERRVKDFLDYPQFTPTYDGRLRVFRNQLWLIARLREAETVAGFYADRSTWQEDQGGREPCQAYVDCGEKARDFLAKLEE